MTIDELQIQIQSRSTEAAAGIDKLEASLNLLKTTAKGGAGLTATVNQLKKLSEAMINVSVPTEEIRGIVDALKPLSEIQKSNLGTTLNQLKKIPEVIMALESTDLRKFYNQIQSITRIIRPLATEMEKVSLGFSKLPANIQKAINANAKLTTSNKKTGKSFSLISGPLAKLSVLYLSLRRVARVISDWVEESNAYVEDLNLFHVAMGQYADEAKAYAEKVSEIFGLDPREWMRYQAVFMNMASGFGIASEKAVVMSKNLTQLGYDLASVFNVKFDVAMEKLQSAISGQPRPMREWGFDLSEATMKAVALRKGIEKNVETMSQMEKAQLRYVQLLETAQKLNLTGDLARTLEAPANQLRILNANATQAARALGNIFIPALNAVLPYAIAFLKVVRNTANSIANLFGFSLPEIDYSGLTEVGAIAEDDTEAVKELKNALLGIDELNILSENKTGSLLGDDLDIELPEYDFLKDLVSNNANQIAEKLQKPFEDTLTIVASIGAGLLAWKISNAFMTSIASIQNLFTVAGGGSVVSVLKNIGGHLLIIAGLASTVYGGFKAITEGVKWDNLAFMIGGVAATAGGLAIAIGSTAAAIGLLIGGVALLAIGFNDVSKNGLNLQNTLLLMAGTFATTLGMSMLTHSVIPLLVAGLALIVGGIVDIINNGVTLENSLLVIGGIMATTLVLAIKAVTAGMTSLGITIGLVGLAIASLVGAFLYISSVWDQLSGWEKAATIFTGLAAAILAAALAIAVFHASWSMGLAVAGIVGGLAAIAVAFASVKGDIDKTAKSGQTAGSGSYSLPSNYSPNSYYVPQQQSSTYSGVAYQNQYQGSIQQTSSDSKEIIGLLQEIANKDPNLYVDGSKLNQSLYPYSQQYSTQRGTVLVR